MLKFIWLLFFILGLEVSAQNSKTLTIDFVNEEINTLPDKIVNIPFFIKNYQSVSAKVKTEILKPTKWGILTKIIPSELKPHVKKFSVVSIRIPSDQSVGSYNFGIKLKNSETGRIIAEELMTVRVKEVVNISLQLIESSENIFAGETYKARYLVQNSGNTEKRIFLETSNCEVEGEPEIKLLPGTSSEISIYKTTSSELIHAKKEFYAIRALSSGEVKESMSGSVMIFPVKKTEKDLYFRFPIEASASYLATNQRGIFQSAYQFELSGHGKLDPGGKHQLMFLARGPNSADMGFLGLYDQYYISYLNKNLEITVGEKSYSFTPLTESSRFGLGAENKILLNNGLSFGFLYVKPRFYNEIKSEMAFFSQFEKKENKAGIYYIVKKNEGMEDLIYLASINTSFKPFEKTMVDFEVSRGFWGGQADNAFRTYINSQFFIFSVSGNYFYAGKKYPGYYSNSTFYSGSLAAQVTSKINLGVYARRDFQNAQLDTFFISSPYSSSIQTFINYKIAPRSYLKIYWREYERKDRLALDKFHYKTRSLNCRFRQRLNRFEYNLLGEYGETTNFLLEDENNKQDSYRGTANLQYRFNSSNTLSIFGSWSNINSFVSDDRRRLTAGLTLRSQIFKNLKANFHLQNAYDIDDYYRNRNLMQFHLDYDFLKNHKLSLRSYYMLFRREVENPEFFISATYTCKIGVPLKKIASAGTVRGRITNDDDEPEDGIVLNFLNKKTITDNKGFFEFRSVHPGLHLLSIDRSKFEIDEIPGIPMPIKVEVIEDRETTLNFKITKGAKLEGRFNYKVSDSFNSRDDISNELNNIIVELKNDFKQYRIATDSNGKFSFPIIIPGKWIFRIYENSIPDGFEIEKKIYHFDLSSGEKVDLNLEIKPKKRKIIFKNSNIDLGTLAKGKIKPLKPGITLKMDTLKNNDEVYYSVQIGAFSRKVDPNSSFFRGRPFDFEKQINNLYKYYIGRFDSLEKAMKEKDKLQSQYKGAFVVAFKNDKLIYIDDQ